MATPDPRAPERRETIMGASGRPIGWHRPAAAVYTGVLPDGRFVLVTVWGDGSAEVAMRLKPSDTWSAPEPLTRAHGDD